MESKKAPEEFKHLSLVGHKAYYRLQDSNPRLFHSLQRENKLVPYLKEVSDRILDQAEAMKQDMITAGMPDMQADQTADELAWEQNIPLESAPLMPTATTSASGPTHS